MRKDRISFVGNLVHWGIKEENRRCIIIPLDDLTDVRSNFDEQKLKITLEKIKL